MSLQELETQLRPIFLAALAGDAAAYRLFLDAISLRLRGYLSQMLARTGRTEASEVEDVLQETLLALHLSRHTYDAASPVTAWAHAIARYKLVDHLRRSGRHAGALPLEDEAHQLAGPPESAAVDARLDLARAMEALPERSRRLIDQVKLQGASIADAADAVGMTETAAKVAIHRGLQAWQSSFPNGGQNHDDAHEASTRRNLSPAPREFPLNRASFEDRTCRPTI